MLERQQQRFKIQEQKKQKKIKKVCFFFPIILYCCFSFGDTVNCKMSRLQFSSKAIFLDSIFLYSTSAPPIFSLAQIIAMFSMDTKIKKLLASSTHEFIACHCVGDRQCNQKNHFLRNNLLRNISTIKVKTSANHPPPCPARP